MPMTAYIPQLNMQKGKYFLFLPMGSGNAICLRV